MSNNIASKNAYELLGNDPELDSDREPEPPTKAVDKPVQRSGKRNPGADGPSSDAPRGGGGGRGGRDGGFTRGDQAGSMNNRSEQRDDGLRQDRHANRTREPRAPRGDRGDRGGRGGRGGRGFNDRYQRTNRDDRQNHSGQGEHEKQAAHGWGGDDGNSEWKDEVAGEAIAKAEANDDAGFTPDVGSGDPAFVNGPGADGEAVGEDAMPEPEEKTMSYDEYLAQQKEKRAALGGETLQVRKANEGSKQKFPEGTAVARTEQEDFFAGSGGKARREREQKKKEQLQLDGQYYAAADSGDSRGGRGGRGRGRGEGGRGRGEGFRGRGEGGRGRGEGRGGGRGRGEGFRGRGEGGGGFRGGNRGGPGGNFNATDQSAFPALGGS